MHCLSLKRRSLIFLVSSILLLSVVAPDARAERKLKLGVFVMDPMVTRDAEGKYHGAVVEVAEKIAGLEGWELEILQCDFHECLSWLETEKLDLASPVAFTKERAEKYSYNKETLLMDWGQVYVGKDQRISSVLDLQGKRVVTLNKTVFNKPFLSLLSDFDIHVDLTRVSDYLDVFRYVQDGRADAMILNRTFGEKNIKGFDKVIKTPIIFKPIDIRFATPKGKHKDIRDALDRRLRELKADPLSEYYMAIERMFGARTRGYHLPHWVRWAAIGGAGLIFLFFGLSLILQNQVNHRTEELLRENEERRLAEKELFESRESFRTLVEFTDAIHWELHLKSWRFIYVSPQAVSLLGYPISSWIDIEFWKGILHPEDRDWAYEFCVEESGKGNDHELVYRVIDSEGRVVWLRDIVKVIIGDDGPEKLIGIMFDISKEKINEEKIKASLQEKEVLLKEIHHRVKNNMAIVSSLSSLQATRLKDEEAKRILKEGRNRIRTMALVHEHLYRSENISDIDVKSYLKSLIENVSRSYNVLAREKLTVESDNIRLNIDTLIPCGLIINELLTNSFKYAYDTPGSGEISVSLRQLGDGLCSLMVRDHGKGFPEGFDPENHDSLGLKLVKSLAGQLDGQLSIESNGGVAVRVTFKPV